MQIIHETEPYWFDAWSGGNDTMNDIHEYSTERDFNYLAEEMFPNGCTETEFNDWLWFDRDWIYEQLGIYEDVYGKEEDDEDEEEE